MDLKIISFLLIIGLAQGYLLGLLLLLARYFRSKANSYLGLMIITITTIGLIFQLSNFNYEPLWLILLNDIMLEFLFPVFFLLYYAYSFENSLSKNRRQYFLYLPFLLAAIINLIIDLEVEFHWINIGAERNEASIEVYYFIEYCLTVAYTIALSIWSYFLIKNYLKTPTDKPKSNWFLQFWIMANTVILIWLLDLITDIFASINLLSYLFSSIILLFFWISYRGIYQFKLAEEKFEIRQKRNQIINASPNQHGSAPTNSSSENLHLQRFQQLIEEESIFRDPNISRDTVAERLGISSGYFSQLFNGLTEKNFSEYLNEHRVADVKKMLLDSEFNQYSLVAIGYEAGFTSKSSFYAVFKKATGLTPSAYKKAHLKTPQSA